MKSLLTLFITSKYLEMICGPPCIFLLRVCKCGPGLKPSSLKYCQGSFWNLSSNSPFLWELALHTPTYPCRVLTRHTAAERLTLNRLRVSVNIPTLPSSIWGADTLPFFTRVGISSTCLINRLSQWFFGAPAFSISKAFPEHSYLRLQPHLNPLSLL